MAEVIGNPEAAGTVHSTVLEEIKLGIHKLNGENNHKTIKDKKCWQYNYTSTSRTVMRNMWLMDYIECIMGQMHEHRDKKFSSCIKDAYHESLAKHHPWLVKKAATLGMSAVGGRDAFLQTTSITYEQI